MTAFDTHRPQDAPETILAADGKTTLYRYRVDAVMYAPSRADAIVRLEHGAVYLDAARLLRDERCPRCAGPKETDFNSLCSACQPLYGDALLAANRQPDFRVRPPGWPEDDLLGQSVCAAHVPDYATGEQQRSDAPCVVCGEPSVMVLPKIIVEGTP